MTDNFMVVVLGAIFFLFLLRLLRLLVKSKKGPTIKGLVQRPILTPNEIEFFQRLTRALPRLHVFPQVSFSALLNVDRKLSASEAVSLRNVFSQKYADFVICERDTLHVLAIVELDDRTHDHERDAQRDALLDSVNYRVLRFNSRAKPSEEQLAMLMGA